MPLSGGDDRSLMRGLRPDGSTYHELDGHEIVGNLPGEVSGLNIAVQRAGLVFQWADTGANRASVLQCRHRGWWVADPIEEGRAAVDLMEGGDAEGRGRATPDDNPLYPGLVLMCTSVENYRRLQEANLAANRAQLSPNTDFVAGDEGSALGRRTGTQMRFADPGSGVTLKQGEHTLAQLTPDGALGTEEP